MNNKQILDNAPEGATHVDINGHYWHNSSAFYWLCCDDGSTCAGDIGNNARSLADIKEIESLRSQLNAKSPLEREAVPTMFIGSNLTLCTHRVGKSDIAVWCKGADAVNLMNLLDSAFDSENANKLLNTVGKLKAQLATAKADGIREFSRHLLHKAQEVPLGLENKSKGASVYNWLTTISRDARHYANQLNEEQGE